MRYSLSFLVTLAVLVVSLSCKQSQQEPAPPATALNDSLISVTIPDFAATVTNSRTPKGKLDKIITTYGQGIPTSYTLTILYDARQRIIGRTVFNSPSRGIDNATIYEYKNELPYRTFTKVSPSTEQPNSFYFMDEFVRDATGRHIAQLLYRVELDGQARLLERSRLIYNSANHLVETKDPNGFYVGQLFDYDGDNIKLMSHKYANGTVMNSQTEYRYDNKPNVLKGIFWTMNLDYIQYNLSNNNLIRRTIKDNLTNHDSLPTEYITEYDTQDRLVRRSTTSSAGLVVESYIFND